MFIKCEYMLYVHYYMNVEYYMFDVKNVKICTLVLYKVLLQGNYNSHWVENYLMRLSKI